MDAEVDGEHRLQISHALLRLSYSLTADRVPSFVSNARPIFYSYNIWRPVSEQQEQGVYMSNIANTELTYEKKKEFTSA